ncbi:MAG: hypothetical protein A3G32_00975 [Deltaproteobacteria bacterium RIFCSPLOWO2_12_FULL_40_28]|nr:MAG: hypothetical protein A3C45_09860 [Deltaproteobacteria bacterium RIFCSPHIGHO2_02_FULL_40_28]OGQ19910.1 MAG: hypothetical protein A3E27_06810 [Deltaproteobacteria bacterium RIFCSPHIGHO2_12_FULL_40_32]OGQ39669.1 MAG: hypothetical protein A3I69_06240 [Deltaproteobacteria bacterium RIFCSPLOWO2_02_FULL_40_36]OGQ52925.1 MAG: hypothetical protein A3G32_00975 [Deltaproteobacteria bacterium RIFCSPLOWO2_12_FULL_40_28]
MTELHFFSIFALITVVMALLMILQRNPVSSALCLVFSFFGLAALYVLADAAFVGTLQILVYAGAIMVLFVFIIMLLNLNPKDLEDDHITPFKVSFLSVGLVVLFYLAYLVLKLPLESSAGIMPENFGQVEPVARLMFQTYLIPFEIASILILIAIVGVVLLAKRKF